MNDYQIVELFWQRNEHAISQCSDKYGAYCYRIAFNILNHTEDSEECVNDTWLRLWDSIPPQNPKNLSSFIAKVTRNIAINRLHNCNAQKRGGGKVELVIEELNECLPAMTDIESEYCQKELVQAINRFLRSLQPRDREIFLRRYFFVESTSSIGAQFEIKESNVLLILSRVRKKLRTYLQEGGYFL